MVEFDYGINTVSICILLRNCILFKISGCNLQKSINMRRQCNYYAKGNANVSCTVTVMLVTITSYTQTPGSEPALTDLKFSTAF